MPDLPDHQGEAQAHLGRRADLLANVRPGRGIELDINALLLA